MSLECNAWSYEFILTKPNLQILTKSGKPPKNLPKIRKLTQKMHVEWREREIKETYQHNEAWIRMKLKREDWFWWKRDI